MILKLIINMKNVFQFLNLPYDTSQINTNIFSNIYEWIDNLIENSQAYQTIFYF